MFLACLFFQPATAHRAQGKVGKIAFAEMTFLPWLFYTKGCVALQGAEQFCFKLDDLVIVPLELDNYLEGCARGTRWFHTFSHGCYMKRGRSSVFIPGSRSA